MGIHVVRQASACCSRPDVTFAEAAVGGLRLLELIEGYERLILVDAIQTPDGQPGAVHRLHLDDVRASLHAGSTHDLSLAGALAFGRGAGMSLPEDEQIAIIAIEAADVLTFGEALTHTVAAAIPAAVQSVCYELGAPAARQIGSAVTFRPIAATDAL